VLVVVGCGIYRQVWAEVHYRRAEEALARSVRVKGPAPLAEARSHLACCLKVWPNNPRVNFLMAQAARRTGDPDEAGRYLRRAEQLGWVAEAIDLEKALADVQQGDLERLEPVLASFVQRDHPDKLLILEALVQGSRRTYQLPRALSYLDTWLGFQPDSVRALVWRGETLLLVGRNQDALADYRKAIKLDPQEDEARLTLAELFLAAPTRRCFDPLHRIAETTSWPVRRPCWSGALSSGKRRYRRGCGSAGSAALLAPGAW
jgi:tetratricopeptide (TPR) repeat protein